LKATFRLVRKSDAFSPWQDTWADFVFESRRATGMWGRLTIVFSLIAALVRILIASRPSGAFLMRNFQHDVIHAARRLRRTPLYTSFAAITLGIGIAATTALYSLLYSIVWKPDATVAPEQIVELRGDAVINGSAGVAGRFSWPDWQSLMEQQHSFTNVAGSQRVTVTISDGTTVDAAMAETVTSGYFSLVGIAPEHGRLLGPSDSEPGAPPVAVMVARLARARFGDAKAAVGRTLNIGGQLTQVVGVVTDNFYGFGISFAPTALWLPVEQTPRLSPMPYSSFDPARRDRRWLTVRGRLRDGVTLPKAAEEVSLIGQRVEAAFPSAGAALNPAKGPRQGPPPGRYWRAEPVNLREADAFSSLGVAMMVGVSLVLVMVCSNLASLGLSRSAARQPEFAVRRALGASRWRLIREQLTECALVVSAGAIVGLAGARWLTTWMHVDIPISRGMSLSLEPEISWPVLAATAGASILSMIFVGLGPALRATRADIRPDLAQDGASTKPRVRSQHLLVAAQVAGSATLLLLAVSIMNTVSQATRSPGVDVDRIAVASIAFYQSPREPLEADRLRDDILQRLRQVPGIERVAASVGLPFGMGAAQGSLANSDALLAGSGDAGENAYFVFGTEELMDTLGVAALRGRSFSADEVRDKRPVIVLSERTARAVFGTSDVVGRTVWLRATAPARGDVQALTVVGVSADTDVFNMGSSRRSGAVFMPYSRDPRDPMVITARTQGDTAAVAGIVRRAIREADAGLVVDKFGSGWVMLSGRYLFLGALAWASTGLGALTLVLVMSGLFGVLSALVTQQTREFGIRMALGGTPGDLLRLVVWQGLRPARDGLIVGLILGVLSRMALGSIFPSRIPVVDVVAFIVVPIVIIGTTIASSILPARRAARVDPNIALRQL
jgi:putative ABC transport system permease protein